MSVAGDAICPRCVAWDAADVDKAGEPRPQATLHAAIIRIAEAQWQFCQRHDLDACEGCGSGTAACFLNARPCCPDCKHLVKGKR